MDHAQGDVTTKQPGGQGTEFLRLTAVIQRTGLGRSTIHRLMACQQFPRPVRLAIRVLGHESELRTLG